MTQVLKLLTEEIAISTANTVANNVLVRVTNPTTSNVLLTQANTGGTIASTTVLGNSAVIVMKANTDTLAGTGLKATAVAYKN